MDQWDADMIELGQRWRVVLKKYKDRTDLLYYAWEDLMADYETKQTTVIFTCR